MLVFMRERERGLNVLRDELGMEICGIFNGGSRREGEELSIVKGFL